jgi:hypothetical protein
MLDEGLAVVSGLWSGESFQYDGIYYHLKPTIFRPKPLQQPRIPIWVAGVWPHKRPLRRMACWDGMFPLFWGIDDPAEQQAHLREMVAEVLAIRQEMPTVSSQLPFDIVTVGETPPDQPAQTEELIAGFGAGGATWWLESLAPERGGGLPWSFSQLRERVLAGPLGAK